MSHKNNRTEVVTVRMDPLLKNAAKKVSIATERTLGSMIHHATKWYIKEHYPEAMDPNSKITIWSDKKI